VCTIRPRELTSKAHKKVFLVDREHVKPPPLATLQVPKPSDKVRTIIYLGALEKYGPYVRYTILILRAIKIFVMGFQLREASKQTNIELYSWCTLL